jgi:hypothetical protein
MAGTLFSRRRSTHGRNRRLIKLGGLLVLVAALSSLTLASGIAGAATSGTPSASAVCAQKPLPADCVTSIKFIDPSTFTSNSTADGGLVIQWSPDAPGVTEQLSAPETLAQAQQQAAQESIARGLAYGTPNGPALNPGPPVQSAKARRAHKAATYTSYCVEHVHQPYDVMYSSYYHLHAESDATCSNVYVHSIVTNIYEGSYNDGGDSCQGLFGNYCDTDAVGNAHYTSTAHTWWNYSDFFAELPNGQFMQGPSGYYLPITRHLQYGTS